MSSKTVIKTVFIFFSLVSFLVSNAIATHSYSNHVYTISGESTNLSQMSTNIGNTAIVRNVGTVWYVNCSIAASSATVYINDSEATMVVWGTGSTALPAAYIISGGTLRTNDVTIKCFDYNLGQWVGRWDDDGPDVTPTKAYTNDTIFDGINYLDCAGYDKGQVINNITFLNGTHGNNSATTPGVFLIEPCTNVTVTNLTINGTAGCGINIMSTTGFNLTNANIQHCGTYTDWSNGGGPTSQEGISIYGESGAPNYLTTLRNILVNDTSYSALNLEGNGEVYEIRGYNITVENAAHNAFDLHGGGGHYFENVKAINGYEQDSLLISSYDTIFKNVTLSNIHGNCLDIDSPGDIDSNTFNVTMTNLTMGGVSTGAQLGCAKQEVFINASASQSNGETGLALDWFDSVVGHRSRDNVFVDWNFPNNEFYNEGINNSLVNCKYGSLSMVEGNYYTYMYPNLVVKDPSGNPIAGAAITFSQNAKNGYGVNQATFYTDSNGKLFANGNRTNWAAIPYQYNNGGSVTTYATKITATANGQSNSTSVTPSSTWYTENPASLSGPQIILTLNTKGTTSIYPAANFTSNVSSGYTPLTVQFTDLSTNVTGWQWNFGDGTLNSTLQNPIHTFNNPGSYKVTLTASNANGSSTTTKQIVASFAPNFPVANFSTIITSGNLTVQFTDLSTGYPTSWSWNFGDGQTSTSQNPNHVYSTAGTYTVNLTTSNTNGMSSKLATIIVSLQPVLPVANFSSNVTSGYVPLDVQFTDRSTGAPTTWLWNFGDGTTSNIQNPTHTYVAKGTYTVNLSAMNANGVSSKLTTINVTLAGLDIPYWVDANKNVYVPVNISAGKSITLNVFNISGYSPDGYIVFPVFFEDFENYTGSVWDSSHWTENIDNGAYRISNGSLDMHGANNGGVYWIVGNTGIPVNNTLLFRAKLGATVSAPQVTQEGWTNGVSPDDQNCMDYESYQGQTFIEAGNGVTINDHDISPSYFGNMADYEIVRAPNATKYYVNSSLVYSSPTVSHATLYPHMFVRDSKYHVICDYVAIRQYASVEPTVTIQDMGTFKKVTITNKGPSNLSGYQLKLNGSQLGVASRKDSIKITVL